MVLIYIYIYTKSIFLIRYVFCSPTYICAKSNKIMACYEQILLLHNSSGQSRLATMSSMKEATNNSVLSPSRCK